ncbi:hypothetical protein M569_16709, partial [Genlisea aurea]
NGYPTNPPPSGAPPPTNAYYGYNQNIPYYQPDPYNVRRAIWLRRILSIVIALVVLFAAVVFIVWLVLRPQLPQFRVNTISISNFTLSNSSTLTFSSKSALTVRNPNEKMSLHYDHLEAELFYRSWSLAATSLPPLSQGTETESSLSANFAAAGSFLDAAAVDGINGEMSSSDGNVGFNLRIVSWVRFQAKAWRTRRRPLKVFCGDLVVRIAQNSSSGFLDGGPIQCHVGI